MKMINSGRDFTLTGKEMPHSHPSADYRTVTCNFDPQLTMISEPNNFSCCQGPLEFIISNKSLLLSRSLYKDTSICSLPSSVPSHMHWFLPVHQGLLSICTQKWLNVNNFAIYMLLYLGTLRAFNFLIGHPMYLGMSVLVQHVPMLASGW